MWTIDFQFDVTVNGRAFKLCNIVDEYTREALAIHVDRNIDADTTVAVLDKIAAERGRHPVFIRCDNGPELTAHALRDWCRFGGAGTHYIGPGAPWQDPFIESFNSRLRDECLATEHFDSLLEAQVVIEDWRIDYNYNRPHSALGDWACSPPPTTRHNRTHPNSHNPRTNNRGPATSIEPRRS